MVELALELELVKRDLVRLNLRVDSVLQSMKVQSGSVDNMVTTLKAIINNAYLAKNRQISNGDMT